MIWELAIDSLLSEVWRKYSCSEIKLMIWDNEQHVQVTAPLSGSSGEFSVSGSQSSAVAGLRHWAEHTSRGCGGVPAAPASTSQATDLWRATGLGRSASPCI